MATKAEPEKWMWMKGCLYLQLVHECSPCKAWGLVQTNHTAAQV